MKLVQTCLFAGEDGFTRVLLLTSRETKRWIIPKGWPMKDLKPYEAAAKEALEEAGVVGTPGKEPLGTYTYMKCFGNRCEPCRVEVYLLKVEKQRSTWREKGQREIRWCTPEEASELVEERELAVLLRECRSVPSSCKRRNG